MKLSIDWKNEAMALSIVLITTIACCSGLYPLLVWGFASAAVKEKAEGSLLRDSNGKIVGSSLVAQSFTTSHYFWPRPSAVDYDGSATGGSNLAPTNPELRARVEAQLLSYSLDSTTPPIPLDLVTTSASGLDPHISLESAIFQADRVASARAVPKDQIISLIQQEAEPNIADLGRHSLINVLKINQTLDHLFRQP